MGDSRFDPVKLLHRRSLSLLPEPIRFQNPEETEYVPEIVISVIRLRQEFVSAIFVHHTHREADMFWELYQMNAIRRTHHSAGEANLNARDAKRTADGLRSDVQSLQRQIDSLTLACQAMWELFSESTGSDEAQLLQRMTEIDGRDGKPDGRISPTIKPCPGCNRPNNSRRPHCLYCGIEIEQTTSFGI